MRRNSKEGGIQDEPSRESNKLPIMPKSLDTMNIGSNQVFSNNSGSGDPQSPAKRGRHASVGDVIRARSGLGGESRPRAGSRDRLESRGRKLSKDAAEAHELLHAYTREILSHIEENDGVAVDSFVDAMRLAGHAEGVPIKCKLLGEIAQSGYFNMVMVLAVLLGTMQVGVETEAKTPDMRLVAQVMDNVCCFIFLLEACVRIGAYGFGGYWKLLWNRFDFALCAINIFETWILANSELFAAYFRGTIVLRFLRVFRLARVLRLFKYFKQLWLVLKGLANAMHMVGWVGLLLLVTLAICSILCRQTIAKVEAIDLSQDFNQEQLFGSMVRSMITLFNIVLLTEDWDAIARPLYDANPLFFMTLVVFLFASTFSLVNVIVGVVVDDVLMNQKKTEDTSLEQQALAHAESMWDIYHDFFDLDANNDGVVDLDEFLASERVSEAIKMVAENHDGRPDFTPQEVKCSGKELFNCMDLNRDGALNRKEFTRGMIATLEVFRHPKQSINFLLSQARIILADLHELQANQNSPRGHTPSQAPTTVGGPSLDGRSSTAHPATFDADASEDARLAWMRTQLERNEALLAIVTRSLGANLSKAPAPVKPPQAAAVPMSARAMSRATQEGAADLMRTLMRPLDPPWRM
jgi:voltage-gated sodium channel